jgi:hypothetical protein
MKRLLSHHELAVLLLLFHAPVYAAIGGPDVEALARDNLVEIVSMDPDEAHTRLTAEGSELLRRLGVS